MALQPQAILAKLRLKPSISLKASKIAIFTILSLMALQASTSALLWYAKHVKATAGSVDVVRTIPGAAQFKLYYPEAVTGDSLGNTFVIDGYNSNRQLIKLNSAGTAVGRWQYTGLTGSNGRVDIADDSQNNIYISYSNSSPARKSVLKIANDGTLLSEWTTEGSPSGGIAIDGSDNVYVGVVGTTSGKAYAIQKLNSSGVMTSEWELPSSASTIAVDASGNMYAGVTGGITKITAGGTVTSGYIPGAYYNIDQAVYSPIDMQVDGSGNLYIAEVFIQAGAPNGYAGRVKEFDASGSFVRKWGGYGSGDGEFGSFNGIVGLKSLAIDYQGNVLTSDVYNYNVQKFSSTGSFISKLTDSGFGNLTEVTGMAYAQDGSLYVVNSNRYATGADVSKLNKYNATTGALVSTLATDGESDGQIHNPTGVAVDTSGNIYVADQRDLDSRIEKFNSSGAYVTSWVVNGSTALAIAPNGNLYSSESGQVRVYNPTTGALVTEFGSLGNGDGQFNTAGALAFDTTGKLYVLSGAQRVQVFDTSNNFVKKWTVAGSGGNSGIAITSIGEVYVSTSNDIKKYDTNGQDSTSWADAGYFGGLGLALGNSNHLYSVSGIDHSSVSYVQYYSEEQITEYADNTSLTLDAGALTNGIVDGDYSAAIPNSGREGVVNFTVTAGALPPGLSLGSVDGIVTGTPTTPGLYTFTVSGQDAATTASREYQIRVYDHGRITTTSLNKAARGFLTSQHIAASDASSTVYDGNPSMSITAGSLPPGTNLIQSGPYGNTSDPSNWYIYGTPTTNGVYDFTVTMTSGQYSDTQDLSIEVVDPVTIITTSLPNASLNDNYSQSVETANATGDVTFSVSSGTLPTGLSLNTSTGEISGTATVLGTSNFTIRAEDDLSYDTQDLSITVAALPIQITTTSLPDGNTGYNYQEYIYTVNAQGEVTYSISAGALPDGLSIDSATGIISGTPTTVGDFDFTVQAQDVRGPVEAGRDNQDLSIHIGDGRPPLQITTSSLPDGERSVNYNEYIYTQDSVSDVTFSLVDGSLPPGLSLETASSSIAMLTGTPTQGGTYTFTVQAQDSRGAGSGTDTQQYSVFINSLPLNITTTSLPAGRVAVVYSDQNINYENAQAQPIFTIFSGSLPNGLSLSLGGTISGTPTVAGTFNFTVQADDGFSTDTQALSITVLPPIVQHTNTPFVTIASPPNNVSLTTNTMAVTGTGPLNQTISLFIDGAQVGTTTTNGSGAWSYTATNITPGNHSFDAKWIPGADVVFVPYFDQVTSQSAIQVINTSNNSLAKTVWLTNGTLPFSATVNHAGTKLYVSALLGEADYAQLVEVDLNSAAIRTLDLPDFASITGLIASADDSIGYVTAFAQSGPDINAKIAKVNLSSLSQLPGSSQIADQVSGNDIARSSMAISADGSKIYSALNGTNSQSLEGGVSVYDTASGAVSTLLLDPGDSSVLNIQALTISGDFLYAVDSNLKVVVVNTTNNAIVTGYGALVGSSGMTVNSIEVDADGSHAYIATSSGLKVMALPAGSITTTVPLTVPMVFGMQLANNDSTLYAVPIFSGVLGLTTSNNSLQSNTTGLIPNDGVSYSLGNRFLGPITPPKDSINFSLATTPPNCTTTNTCPVDCSVTNTCTVVPPPPPPPPATTCTDTNSCPVVITPTVIVPKATPTGPAAIQGKLGWFDRSILALASFIPAKAAIGFPWLLFLLLLLFALSLYYQSRNEVRKEKLNKEFIGKRHSVRQQQDNFIALASHYLNTPITIIQNGVEMMRSQVTAPSQSAKPARPVTKPSPTIPVNSKGGKS